LKSVIPALQNAGVKKASGLLVPEAFVLLA